MKKVYLITLFTFLTVGIRAQLADVTYTVQTVNVTSYENYSFWGSGPCWETGTEGYTAYVGSWDDINVTSVSTGCQQCDNNGNCTYAGGITLQTRSNNAYSIFSNIDAWEDDGGTRCAFDSGDDCRRQQTASYNFREQAFPSNGTYTNGPAWGSTNDHQWTLSATWRYTGSANSITPTCTQQSLTMNSGAIRSVSVYMVAGRTYRFGTCGASIDTYLRIYGSDGYTIVAANDDNGIMCAGTSASLDYVPASSGWYYVELSRFSRVPLSANVTMTYEDVTPPPGNPAVFGTNQWNVYAYTGGNINLTGEYSGFYTEGALSYNSLNRWTNTGSPSDATGWQGCYVPIDNHVVVSKRQGFPCGVYQLDIPNHDDDIVVYVNGVQVFIHNGCCDVHTNIWTGLLDATSTIEVRHLEGGGGSNQSLTLTAVAGPAGNPAVFGTNQWNAYVYKGNNLNLAGVCYAGYYVEPLLSYNSTNRWCGTCSPAAASGYSGYDPGVDYHTVVSKRQGFPCGYYTIDVPAHDDDARLYINGVQVWEHLGCCDSHTGVWSGFLTNTSTVEFRHAEGVGGSYQALTFNVTNSVAPTSVSGGGSYCHGNNVTLTANGGTLGTGLSAQYKWYTGSCGGTLVATTGTNTYTFLAPSSTTNYFVRIEDACGNTACASTTVTLPPAGAALATNGQSATCTVNAGETVRFYHTGTGNYIASVTAGATGLGSTTATAYVDGANQIVPACAVPTNIQFQTAVMQRHWLINPTTNAAATVRLPYTNAEYTSLQTAAGTSGSTFDAVTSQASIKCSKYSNAGTPALMDNTFTNNCGSGATTIYGNSGTGTANPATPGPAIAAWYSDFAIPGFSEFWLHGSNNASPLPVELTSFTATCNETAEEVYVQWTTASEHNSSHFVVERSFDGTNWDYLAEKAAAGNSTNTINYALVDNSNEVRAHDVIYYQLKQYDTDGALQKYGPASAECKNDRNGIELFPNPASEQVTVILHGDFANSTALILTDAQGKELKTVKCTKQTGEMYTIALDGMTPGIYFVRLMNENVTQQIVRFVKR